MDTSDWHHNISVVNLTDANSTSPTPYDPEGALMALVNQILITVALALIMIGMGSTITVREIWVNLKRPTGICICWLSQFGVMPLVAFGLAHLLKMGPHTAIGALVISCCPGGTVSNIFTYWTDGDVCLSICMTTCSTILAVGMMPLCLFVYSRSWISAATVIPFLDITLALVAILVPGGIGMIIKWKSEKVANVVTKVCSSSSMLLIIVITIVLGVSKPEIYRSEWKAWLYTAIFPLVAFGFGFLLTSIFRLPYKKRRTIALETGCQNVALALTVINISFPRGPGQLAMFVVPILYSLFLFIDALLICLGYFVIAKLCKKAKDEEKIVKDEKDVERPDVVVQEKGNENGTVNTCFDDRSPTKPKQNGVFNPYFAPVLEFNPETLDVDYKVINQETQTTQRRRGSNEKDSVVPRTPEVGKGVRSNRGSCDDLADARNNNENRPAKERPRNTAFDNRESKGKRATNSPIKENGKADKTKDRISMNIGGVVGKESSV